MDEILDLAAKLGKQIAADNRTKAFAAARKALDEDSAQQQLLADYEAQQRRIGELQAGGKPIEPEDKRKLQALHERVISSDAIKTLLASQADYVELMAHVSQRIEQEAFTAISE
jgi:cell fate (sporulation/competence/biofilm development) regulator YlbF (YheA/YmcA/DUF963 family)